MIVVDASAVADMLLRSINAERIEAKLFGTGRSLHAPHLVDVEVAHVFRRAAAGGHVDSNRGRAMLDLLVALPMRRHAHETLLPRAWDLRWNVTAYDAMYVVLAELLGASLITCDRRLAHAVADLIVVELV